MDNKQLCQWLRDNSSGVYRPAAVAAERIEELEREVSRLCGELIGMRSVAKTEGARADKRADDYYRLNYIENLYSSGKQKEFHDFMSLVCDRGFRRAADDKRLVSSLPNV
jgi:hypothetical protein